MALEVVFEPSSPSVNLTLIEASSSGANGRQTSLVGTARGWITGGDTGRLAVRMSCRVTALKARAPCSCCLYLLSSETLLGAEICTRSSDPVMIMLHDENLLVKTPKSDLERHGDVYRITGSVRRGQPLVTKADAKIISNQQICQAFPTAT